MSDDRMRTTSARRRGLAAMLTAATIGTLGAGVAHARTYTTSGGGVALTPAVYTKLVELELPRGQYVVFGKGGFTNQQAVGGAPSCNLYGPSSVHLDASTTSLPAPSVIGTASYDTVEFHAVVDLPTGGPVWVECIGEAGILALGFRLSAFRERAVVVDP